MVVMPRRPRVALAAAVLVAAVGGAAGACSGTDAVSQSVGGSNGYQAGDAQLVWVATSHRHPVTGVHGTLLDGSPFDLSALRGKVVVVNFWGSWCAPCVAEAKALEQVYRDERAHGVQFVGIDVRDDRASAQAFVRKHEVSYPSLYDPSSLLALQFTGMPPNATPTTIVVDRTGHVAARYSGQILYTTLARVVDRALAEPA